MIQLLYWILLFARLNPNKSQVNASSEQLTSIVVVFKNEGANLKKLVPKLVEQDHPNFEIILCDDFSTDDYLSYLSTIASTKLRLIKATIDLPGKKSALKEAIASANGENILVTDADCYPANKSWLRSMTSHIGDNKIVLGYSPHLKNSGWLNKFIRYETFLVALQYLSYAIAKIPYMGVGRNLLYKKSLFMNSSAFEKDSKVVSGDDDIFVNAESDGSNTTINLDPNSFVYTYPATTFSSFIRQKRRHVSTASVYKIHHQILLAFYAISHIIIYILLAVSLFSNLSITIVLGFIIVLLIKWIIAIRAMKMLQCSDLYPFFPILDLLMVLYYLFLTPATFFKSKNW